MKTVVVTGASRGLGAAIAEHFVAAGFKVIGLARKESPRRAGVDMRSCDVTDPEAVTKVLADITQDEHLWGLVNAAGIASMNLLVATPLTTVDRIIRTNLNGTIYTCMALAKRFARNKMGRIINFSTVAVPIALKGEALYVASKAGVEGFSRSFAREMADFNVTVNVVAPGPIPTDLTASVPAVALQRIIERQIIQRQFNKDDVVELVDYIMSDKSHMLSGQVFNIGGV